MSTYEALLRDNFQCNFCGKESGIVHHVQYRSHFGTTLAAEQQALSNLITVCEHCHLLLHQSELMIIYLKDNPEQPFVVTEKKFNKIKDRVSFFVKSGERLQ
jgi:hypothetical protein